MMNFRHILFALVFLAFVAVAQVPRTIDFQGVLTDAGGALVPDGNHLLSLKLYTDAAGGTSIYAETQTVAVAKGVFNVMIGSVTPLPVSLAFDRAYFLGVAVDGGSELTPRTPLTAVPYALNAGTAEMAKTVAPNAPGVVTSLNTLSGDVGIVGGGSTTVSQVGNNLMITSTGGTGGSGIQGVQNTDGTIAITNPNGPVATIGVADRSLSPVKINPAGANAGDALVYDGANVQWQTAGGGAGVKSINSLKNDVTLAAGTNVSITPSGNTLTISSAGGGGGAGVSSINTLKNDVTLAAGANVTITPSGNTLTFAATGGGGGGTSFWSNIGNNISNTNTGNVGIGTTSPDTKLHVSGDVHIQGGNGLYFEGGPSDPNYSLKPYDTPAAAGMRLNGFSGVKLATGQGDILNVVDANVGIGTANPLGRLSVSGNTTGAYEGLAITNTLSGGKTLTINQGQVGKLNFTEPGVLDLMTLNFNTGTVGIGTTTPGGRLQVGSTNPFVVSPTGRVGINSSAPLGELHIKTNGATMSEGVVIENPGAGGLILSMNQGTPGKMNFSKLGSPTVDLLTLDYTVNSGNGAIGIGTDTPQYRLHVNGTMNVDGIIYAFGIPLPSDLRLKKDIEPFTHALETIQAIRGVRYTWRTDEFPTMPLPAERQIGVIAQEVEKVLPEVISERKDGYKAVDYTKLVPVLVEAVKEQQKQIETLRSLVDQLRHDKGIGDSGTTRESTTGATR